MLSMLHNISYVLPRNHTLPCIFTLILTISKCDIHRYIYTTLQVVWYLCAVPWRHIKPFLHKCSYSSRHLHLCSQQLALEGEVSHCTPPFILQILPYFRCMHNPVELEPVQSDVSLWLRYWQSMLYLLFIKFLYSFVSKHSWISQSLDTLYRRRQHLPSWPPCQRDMCIRVRSPQAQCGIHFLTFPLWNMKQHQFTFGDSRLGGSKS